MFQSVVFAVLCVAGGLQKGAACSCRQREELESEIIDLYESPGIAVFSGRLIEPIHSYSGSQLMQTFQNITVQIEHTYIGSNILRQHMALSDGNYNEHSNNAVQAVITTHTQTTCCLCGASFNENTPIGAVFVFVLNQGSLSISSCSVSCMITTTITLDFNNRQCAKTKELLERFENVTERKAFRPPEQWIPVDPRPVWSTHRDPQLEENSQKPQIGLPALIFGGLLCCVLCVCAYCAFRRFYGGRKENSGGELHVNPCIGDRGAFYLAPARQPGEEVPVDGIVLNPTPVPRTATEVDQTNTVTTAPRVDEKGGSMFQL